MDLSIVTRKPTIAVNIKLPNGDDTDIIIHVYSPGTKEFKQAGYRITDSIVEQKKTSFSAEERDVNKHLIAAEVTSSWENLSDGGEEIICNPENALSLYMEHDWIYDQVEKELGDKDNFLTVAL